LPHGETGSVVKPLSLSAAIANATGLSPGKFEEAFENALLSAQMPEGNAAFSTFVPRTIFPLSSLTAAPTLNCE
jgi:hypothetical protein